MSIEEREGVLDQVSEKGVLLSGNRLSYSKWFEGDRPTEDALGCRMRVIVDAGQKCTFLKRVISVGEKAAGWKPPEPGGKGFFEAGGGRKLSPEELELKRLEGPRMSRNCAIDQAAEILEKKIPLRKLALLAPWLASFTIDGTFPKMPEELLEGEGTGAISPPVPSGPTLAPLPPATVPSKESPPRVKGTPAVPAKQPRPKRLEPKKVNALFNEAKQAGLLAAWKDYEAEIRRILKAEKSAYQMSSEDFERVESALRPRLSRPKVA